MKEEIENLKFKFKNQVYQIKFSLFIKQCYHTVWSVGKIHEVKIQKLEGQKTKEQRFFQNVECVIVKNQNLLKS